MLVPDAHARRAEASDRVELERLGRCALDELTPSRGGSVWARREGAWLSHSAGEPLPGAVFVGTLDGVVVGVAAVEVQALDGGAPLAVLRAIYVEPQGRGLGVGERLMAEVLALASAERCEGIDSFVLPGNRDAKNFFEAHGLVARGIVVHRHLMAEEP